MKDARVLGLGEKSQGGQLVLRSLEQPFRKSEQHSVITLEVWW